MHPIIGGYQMAVTEQRKIERPEKLEPEIEIPVQEIRRERQKQGIKTEKLWKTFRTDGINDLTKLTELENLLVKEKAESGKINAVQGAITNYNKRRKNILKAIALVNNRK